MLTTDKAVKQYKIVVITIERIIALGKFFWGALASSAMLAISSNPMYAKKTKAIAEKSEVMDAVEGTSR